MSPFEQEVSARFGLIPKFFQTASDAPGVVEELWGFAKAGYLNNPLPSLFKERLFVHLSRQCEASYCIVRHVAFLVGQGNMAGDPNAKPHSIDEAITLLQRPFTPDDETLEAALARLEAMPTISSIPSVNSLLESDVFMAATIMFVTPARSARARNALVKALGNPTVEILTAFLAFVGSAHFWASTHPELPFDDDMNALLSLHPQLAKQLGQ